MRMAEQSKLCHAHDAHDEGTEGAAFWKHFGEPIRETGENQTKKQKEATLHESKSYNFLCERCRTGVARCAFTCK